MRKVLFFLSFLLLPILATAQSSQLKNEILNYKDTTLDFIEKGRQFMINKLMDGDMAKVRELKNELLLEENEKYMAIYPYEIRLLLYWLGDYDELFYFINSTDEQSEAQFNKKIKPAHDVLLVNLLAVLRKDRSKVENNITHNISNLENRDFLILNLRYLLGGKDYPDITQQSLNADADTFLLKHPESKYTGYTRENIRYKMVQSNWGWGFEFFSGYGLCTNQLHDKFQSNVPFGVDFDIAYKNWTLYLRDYIGIGSTYQNISYNGAVWPKGAKANTIVPEASLGYTILTKKHVQISPFAGIGALDFSPTESQKDESYYTQVGSISAFTYTVGLNLDIPLGKSSNAMPIISYSENGKWFLRLRYAYVLPQFGLKYSGFEGNMHYFTIGIGAIAHKVKRDL
jgi:hypothetical protein